MAWSDDTCADCGWRPRQGDSTLCRTCELADEREQRKGAQNVGTDEQE